jgi:hypothetical protein
MREIKQRNSRNLTHINEVPPDQLVSFIQGDKQFDFFGGILFNVSLPKIIRKTPIEGRKTTLKEYIGEDDAQISFNGILTGPNGQRPVQDFLLLKSILDNCNIDEPIEVISSILNNEHGIFNMVVERYDFAQEAGKWSSPAFTIQAISDAPLLAKGILPSQEFFSERIYAIYR